jgi:putative methyltransferase (TIGR04325 family)
MGVKQLFRLKNKALSCVDNLRKSPAVIGVYDNRLLAEVVSKKTQIYLNQHDEKILPNSNYLPLLTAFHLLDDTRKVIDFGGAAGIHFFLSKPFVPNLDSWTVIETKAMVEQQADNREEKLKFCTMDDLIDGDFDCDLLYLSGSLPYVEDPLQTLAKLLSTNPRIVLISRTSFNQNETNVNFTQTSKLSSNGPGPLPLGYEDCKIEYEVNVPNYNQVIELLEDKYSIQWTCSENEEIVGPDNLRYQYLSILAKRKNS